MGRPSQAHPSAMTKQAELCGFLYENGFTVLNEVLARTGRDIQNPACGYIKA